MTRILEALDRLLIQSQGEIRSRLEEVSFNFEIGGTQSIGHCHCVKSDANGNLRLRDLVEFIDEKVVEYAIPKKEIDDALQYQMETGSPSRTNRLRRKAAGLFTDLEKTGEGGEILLYILTQEFLKLPQLISKMSLKTSGNIHYQGADGIHVGYDKEAGQLNLYWGEAKMYQSMSSAMDECLKSIKSFLLDPISDHSAFERDIQLINANMSANVNDGQLENLLVRYFDKDDNLSNSLLFKGICFIGFDSHIYPTDVDQPKAPPQIAQECIDKWYATLGKKICTHPNLDLKEIHFFLMPFKSVAEFRKFYLKEIN